MTGNRSGPGVQQTDRPAVRPIVPSDLTTFIAAIRSHDEQAGAQCIRHLIDAGAAVDMVYLDLIAPAARELGTMWENDDCDFVEVTVALGRMQRLLRDLSQLFLADAGQTEPVGNILLTCIPGEQHTLGIIMVGEFLLRDGWRVLVGAPWTEGDLLTMVGTEWYDVIGFSVGSEQRLSMLRRDIRRLRAASRNPHVQIMVGGQVFSDEPELAQSVGADAIADSAREAPRVAHTLLASARAAQARHVGTVSGRDVREARARD
ncbi:MAG: hypothetical protein RLZZ621_1300 [Gemmatimonadota bacterium]|jgi:methanogenic corrinoid protein MtbC1